VRKLIRPWADISQLDIDNKVHTINKLCKSNHPNIVQILGYGWLKPDGAFYFIDMELCKISLEKYIQLLPESSSTIMKFPSTTMISNHFATTTTISRPSISW
jgi:hypothetical protein